MDRRRFFGAVLGAVLAPLACKAAPLSIYDEMLMVDYSHYPQVTSAQRVKQYGGVVKCRIVRNAKKVPLYPGSKVMLTQTWGCN